MKKWPLNRLDTFCSYCSKFTGRVRLNFDNKQSLAVHCNNCGRDSVLLIGAQNLTEYLELILHAITTDEKSHILKLTNIYCPFDGKNILKYIIEAVSVDEDEDVDTERFVLCSSCRRKFTLTVLDFDNDSNEHWKELTKMQNSTS